MEISNLLKKLNDKQRNAVSASQTNLLVLAGAGSGKTRVLVHRIAWLQSVEKCSPYSIMAVTFTNKAATEMYYRITQLMGTNQDRIWVGTFHGLAYRLLRTHYIDANLPQEFQILDNENQIRLLKNLLKEMNIDDKKWRKAMWYINAQKDAGFRPFSQYKLNSSSYYSENFINQVEKIWKKVYWAYQKICDRTGLVDFSELLLRVYELCLNKPHILQYYRKRFTNILVDEFQDTNNIQYKWIRQLAGKTGKVTIVGDEDQSIYGWRGAKIGNIQRFLKDFQDVKTIYLDQNYRSTNNILTAANSLIKNNNGRLEKKLWTNSINGEPISLYRALNELDEAYFVANKIKIWKNTGGQFKQCAILYRSNIQSRILEEIFSQEKIPYHIYGGMRFFDHQEVKDALSYLCLIDNHNNDAAFERIINTPKRGIGNQTLKTIRQASQDRELTFWQASHELLKEKVFLGHISNTLQHFLNLIERLTKETNKVPLHVQTERVIKDSGLWMMYEQKKDEKKQKYIENLKELITATRQFGDNEKYKDLSPLRAFLSHTILESDKEQKSTYDAVQLMTLHSAKGLEFPQVFIVGMQEGIFPSQMSLEKADQLEEERRLAYVGVTRAMFKLTLSYSKISYLYGKEVYQRPSRFISELINGYK